VSEYYITVPTNVDAPTKHGIEEYSEQDNKFATFANWQDNRNPAEVSDADIQAYPTLFDYWESEVYVVPPVLTGLDADYIIVNVAAEKLSEENVLDLYTMKQQGGDETKAFWFMKIADVPVLDYYQRDLQSYTDKFWDETFLGHLIPFTPIAYVDPNNTELQSKTYLPGYLAIYVKDIKFPTNGGGPFELVYVPPSFERDQTGPLTGPLIYKINKDYNPNQ